MENRVLVNVENIAMFECPKCGTSRTVNMADKKHLGDSIKTRCTCKNCNHTFVVNVIIERRKYYRKEADFPGEYFTADNKIKGLMKVHNVSLSGIRFKVNENKEFIIDQKISVIFTLDDTQRSEIKKEIIIRELDGLFVNAEFALIDLYDKLASYLFG
jgi:hypothetical protein